MPPASGNHEKGNDRGTGNYFTNTDAGKKTAVIGDFAKTPRYQGAGSSMVNPTRLDSLLDALTALLVLNDAIGQMDHAKNPLVRLVCRVLLHLRDKADRSGKPDLNILFITNMPFRALAKMTLGGVSEAMAEDILLMVNGHFFQGAGRLIRDHFRHQKDDREFMERLADQIGHQ